MAGLDMVPQILPAFESMPTEGTAKSDRRAEAQRLTANFLFAAAMVDLLMPVQRKMRLEDGVTLIAAMLLHRTSPHSRVLPRTDARSLRQMVSTSETHETHAGFSLKG